jgi:hypothetical protein
MIARCHLIIKGKRSAKCSNVPDKNSLKIGYQTPERAPPMRIHILICFNMFLQPITKPVTNQRVLWCFKIAKNVTRVVSGSPVNLSPGKRNEEPLSRIWHRERNPMGNLKRHFSEMHLRTAYWLALLAIIWLAGNATEQLNIVLAQQTRVDLLVAPCALHFSDEVQERRSRQG